MERESHNGFEVEAASDLVEGEYTEDGERRIEEVFYIRLTNVYGDRWRSHRTFSTCDAAERYIPCVEAALDAGASPEVSPRWFSTFPMYGSEAYESYGAAMERRMEEDYD
jgi:hypothetical protein